MRLQLLQVEAEREFTQAVHDEARTRPAIVRAGVLTKGRVSDPVPLQDLDGLLFQFRHALKDTAMNAGTFKKLCEDRLTFQRTSAEVASQILKAVQRRLFGNEETVWNADASLTMDEPKLTDQGYLMIPRLSACGLSAVVPFTVESSWKFNALVTWVTLPEEEILFCTDPASYEAAAARLVALFHEDLAPREIPVR